MRSEHLCINNWFEMSALSLTCLFGWCFFFRRSFTFTRGRSGRSLRWPLGLQRSHCYSLDNLCLFCLQHYVILAGNGQLGCKCLCAIRIASNNNSKGIFPTFGFCKRKKKNESIYSQKRTCFTGKYTVPLLNDCISKYVDEIFRALRVLGLIIPLYYKGT